MRAIKGANLRVTRTRLGYTAVLRIQAADGSSIGYVGRCSEREARAILERQMGAEIGGFSFKRMARKIGRTATRVAKSRVFKSVVAAAKLLPPPISEVAQVADQAATVIRGMSRGSRGARAAWETAAVRARRRPNSPTAVGMRLAMDALGRPTFRRGGARTARRRARRRQASEGYTDALVEQVINELRRSAAEASPAPVAEPEPAVSGEDIPLEVSEDGEVTQSSGASA